VVNCGDEAERQRVGFAIVEMDDHDVVALFDRESGWFGHDATLTAARRPGETSSSG
jgi:hypothetical protein